MKLLTFRHDHGFTLIEALVALVVLVVGVLGLASMQLKAMQGAHVSYQRSVATMAAQDMVERLWIQLGMQGVGSSVVSCPDSGAVALVKNPNFPTEGDPTKLIDSGKTVYQLWYEEWVNLLPTLVDDGSATVSKESGCNYTITISWQDDRFTDEQVSKLEYKTRIISGSSGS